MFFSNIDSWWRSNKIRSIATWNSVSGWSMFASRKLYFDERYFVLLSTSFTNALCTLSNARKDRSRRIRSRWTLYSRQMQLTEINFLEEYDFLLFERKIDREGGAKRKKKTISYSRVIRALHAISNPLVYSRRIRRLWKRSSFLVRDDFSGYVAQDGHR